MKVNSKTEHKIYATDLDENTLWQFEQCLNMDGCVQGALMADAHLGYSAPIGSVLKFKDVISPQLIGYDIGCGVCAAKLNITKDGLDLEILKDYIIDNIPVGFTRHSDQQNISLDTSYLSSFALNKLYDIGIYQIGTLGGGNHFIEIGESENDGQLWIIIHSGSRRFGHGIAEHYMEKAYELNNEDTFDVQKHMDDFQSKQNPLWFKKNPLGFNEATQKYIDTQREKYHKASKDIEGHYGFNIYSDIGKAYLHDMEYCLEYALTNRARMMSEIIIGIQDQVDCVMVDFINRNHNHAELKDGYIIHRKGATHAEKDMWGVIPANMRDGSFIVKGLGDPDSMCSSSHGAGRVLSRSQARKTLDPEEFRLETKNLVTNHTEKMIDESPKAYKDIFEVMKLQEDLVTVEDISIPLLNVKG